MFREDVADAVVSDDDDTLALLLLCCHPSLAPAAQIPLTLRAFGGLTTEEIAAALLTTPATIAQRIVRAKQRLRDVEFGLPPEPPIAGVAQVLYLIFNEGHMASSGAALRRDDLAAEAIRLTRELRRMRPRDAEVAGLLALMLLHDARRAARTTDDGSLVPARRAGPLALGRRADRRGHRARGVRGDRAAPARTVRAAGGDRRRPRRGALRRRRPTGRRSSRSTTSCSPRTRTR